jgi:hemerythrin
MSLLQWDDSYVTGIAAADHEHEILVDMINRVYDGWAGEKDHDPAKLFDDLFNILLSHFGDEDREMGAFAYPGRTAHARDHERALEDLRAIAARADEPSYDLAGALSSCLQFWLVRHIRVHDVPLYEAVEARRAEAAPDRPTT